MRYLTAILFFFIIMFLSCNPITERMERFEVQGIDVSHYQSQINWDTVSTQNIDFAFVKATEGESFLDSFYYKNWIELKRVCIYRGAYHFFRPTISPELQAANFIKKVYLEPGDLPPVLDVEVTDKVDPDLLTGRIKTWIAIIQQHYKVRPIIYTNLKFYHQYLAGDFTDYPMWIARYGERTPFLEFGKKWQFWQYGNRGRLNGINSYVDFNVFNGSYSEFLELTIPNIVTESETFPVSYTY